MKNYWYSTVTVGDQLEVHEQKKKRKTQEIMEKWRGLDHGKKVSRRKKNILKKCFREVSKEERTHSNMLFESLNTFAESVERVLPTSGFLQNPKTPQKWINLLPFLKKPWCDGAHHTRSQTKMRQIDQTTHFVCFLSSWIHFQSHFTPNKTQNTLQRSLNLHIFWVLAKTVMWCGVG